MPDLDKLERLAYEAEAESEGNLARAMTATGVETWKFRDEAHEALRTAFSNPQTVLALLRRIRDLEGQLGERDAEVQRLEAGS